MIQSTLFVSGLSTFLQSLFGTRLPTVVVGSYTYMIPIMSAVQASRYSSYTDPYEVDVYFFFSCSIFVVGVANVHFHVYFNADLIHIWVILSEIHSDNYGNTRCLDYKCMFPNGYGILGIMEKCCQVP